MPGALPGLTALPTLGPGQPAKLKGTITAPLGDTPSLPYNTPGAYGNPPAPGGQSLTSLMPDIPAPQQMPVPQVQSMASLLPQFHMNVPGAQQMAMPTLAPSDYDNEAFMQSIQASRGDVERQVQNALAEINRQKQANLEQVGMIPGRLEGIFAPAEQAVAQQQNALAGAQQNAGLQSFLPAEALSQPTLAALAQQQAIFGGTVPLLESGFNELAQRQTGSAQQLGMTLNEQLSSEGRGYVASRGAEDRGYHHDETMQAKDFNFRSQESAADRQFRAGLFAQEQAAEAQRFQQQQAAETARFNAQQRSEAERMRFQQQQAQADRDFQAQQAQEQRAFETQQNSEPELTLSDFGGREINPLIGGLLDPGLVSDIRNDARWDGDLTKTRELIGQYGADPATLVSKLHEHFKHRTRTASLALSDLGYRPAG